MEIAKVRPMDWSVLQVVQRLGAAPQHKLAERIGRQRSTVNGAVHRLIASGWLKQVGQEDGGRGRPPILLAVNHAAGCFAGIDVSANKLHCAVVAADGTLLDHASARLGEDRRVATVLEQIDLNLQGLLARVDMRVGDLLGLWAGVNGAVSEDGVVVTCASLGWHNEPLRERLINRYDCDVLTQGASAAVNAAAEALMGAGREANSLVYYHAGRGISVKYVERGRPLAGATQRAGELGHIVVAPDGARCACGNRGCLEAVASGPAIVAALRRIPRRELPEPVRNLLRDEPDATAKIVQSAFSHRSRRKTDAISTLRSSTIGFLSMGAAMAIAAYDPEVLVLGGYLFEDLPKLRSAIEAELPRLVLDWDSRGIELVSGEIVTHDRAIGGAAQICQRFWANPRGLLTGR